MLEILLKKNIDVNSIADDNTSPLHYACATGLIFFSNLSWIQTVYILNRSKIIIVLGNPKMVQLLLDNGAGVNTNLKDSIGETPLMYAAHGTGKGNQEFQQTDLKIICFLYRIYFQ